MSPHVKKRQVVGGVVAVGIVLSNISGSTTETASVGSGPQTLNIDQVNLVKTTETPKVVQVKSGDSQTPLKSGGSGRSSGSAGAGRVPNRASAPHRAMHLNPYRTAPRVQTNNPGNTGNTGNSGKPEINQGPKKEILSREFATPGNYQPRKGRMISEEYKVNEDSDQCLAGDEAKEKKNSILRKLGKKTKKTLQNPKAKKDYNSVQKQIQEG